MKTAILSLFVSLLGAAAGATQFSIEDSGDFLPTGQRVEFADRYGWKQYHIRFDFGLEAGGRSLTKDSKLTVRIERREGKDWVYSCRARGRDGLWANINFLHGKGISVVAECRIDSDDFAKAVDLEAEDVGIPNLVFHAIVQSGQARPGAQRGLYIIPSGQFETSSLNAYASMADDPSSPSVVFRSAPEAAPHGGGR